MEPTTTVYLIRHAQSEQNQHGRSGVTLLRDYGALGSPLTEEGRQQAYRLRAELLGLPCAALIASDLTRARETAEILNAHFALPLQTAATIRERVLPETELEAGQRLLAFLNTLAASYQGSTVVVVSHGGIMRGLLVLLGFVCTIDELPPYSIANTGYVVLATAEDGWRIVRQQGITKAPT